MAVDAILAAALSGLQTSQTGLTTVSNNIANVNTPGFAREVVNQAPVVVGGVGEGVSVADIQRVTNQFLESANYQAASDAGSAGIISNLLTQAQGAFGDPSLATSYLNQLSSVFADFTAAANDPASSLPRSQTIADLTSFLNHTQAIAGTLSGLDTQADTRSTATSPRSTSCSLRSTPSMAASPPPPRAAAAPRARRTARACCCSSCRR